MKHQTLIFLLASVMLIVGFSCGCKKEPAPVVPHTYTVSFNVNGGNGSIASQSVTAGNSFTFPSGSSLTYTGYTFQSWNTSADGTGTSYNAGSTFVPTGNITFFAIWQKNAPVYTAVISSTGTYDASTTAVDKVLLGHGVGIFGVLNVTSGSTINVMPIGTLSNGNSAIAEIWVNNTTSTDFGTMTSTLNSAIPKTTITNAGLTISLNPGINVICFKTAAYSGQITNGTQVGLKVTAANNFTLANASYTADASYNVAAVQKLKYVGLTNVVVPSGQGTGAVFAQFQIFPYSDESATVYDGNLYPKISSYAVNTSSTNWISPITNYSNLDFTNAAGSSGQNFSLAQLTSAGTVYIFLNSNANYVSSNGNLKFDVSIPVQIVKSNMGNFAWLSVSTNVSNPGTQFGPANVSWYHQSVKFVGNPETWIYQPNGNRIQ
jgi:hypothetical protein